MKSSAVNTTVIKSQEMEKKKIFFSMCVGLQSFVLRHWWDDSSLPPLLSLSILYLNTTWSHFKESSWGNKNYLILSFLFICYLHSPSFRTPKASDKGTRKYIATLLENLKLFHYPKGADGLCPFKQKSIRAQQHYLVPYMEPSATAPECAALSHQQILSNLQLLI